MKVSNFNLSAQVALVTGSNRGIGFEVCRLLLREGLRVVLSGRDEGKARTAFTQLERDFSKQVSWIQLDVTNPISVRAVADFLEKKHSRLDVLVNNAGILPDNRVPGQFDYRSILDSEVSDFQRAWDTNVLGILRMCQAVLPLMQKNGYGRIVNVSSLTAQFKKIKKGIPAYRVSKVSVNALTKIIADEFEGENILCNAISPGWVKTEMGGPKANVDVSIAAQAIVRLSLLPDGGPTGCFFREGSVIDW